MKNLALLSVFLSLPLVAQTAKVVSLSDEDAKQAKVLYEAKKDLEKKSADFEQKIKDKYLTKEQEYGPYSSECVSSSGTGSLVYFVPCDEKQNSQGKTKIKVPTEGWSYGFQYSEDFRFIVPNPTPSYYGNGITLNPACYGSVFTGTGTLTTVPSNGTNFTVAPFIQSAQ